MAKPNPLQEQLLKAGLAKKSQASAAARVDTAKGPAARLFAFGLDAWRLTGYLEHLALTNRGIVGATGRLRLEFCDAEWSSPVRIDYRRPPMARDETVAVDLHTHGRGPAFWSATPATRKP